MAGASIAFSLGSLIYYFRDRLRLPAWHLPLAFSLYLLHVIFAADLWGFTREPSFRLLFADATYGLYANTLLGAWVLASMVNARWEASSPGVGKWLGDLAYPVFLVHWLAGAVLIGLGIPFDDKLLMIPLAFLLVNLLALGLHFLVESPVNRHLRAAIRRGWMPRPGGKAGGGSAV